MLFPCVSRRKLHRFFNCLIILIIGIWVAWTLRFSLLHALKYTVSSEYRNCVHLRHSYESKVETGPLYITLAQHGRLGNWLYSYASLLGIAKTNGYIPYLPTFHPISYTFSVSKRRQVDAKCLLTVTDPLPGGYVQDFNHLPAANISIDGYIQSWKYFRFIEDEIRKEFTFSTSQKNLITSKYLSYVSKYVTEGRTVISVHVRRGDKLSKGFQGLGFKAAPLEYFRNAMNFMAKRYPFSVFLVVSDEIDWCKHNLKPDDNDTLLSQKTIPIVFTYQYSSSLVDLGLLTMANHSIISVGTFGWWGAWLANGTVVYYENHVIPGSVLDSQTVNEDFFPPHWIPMNSSSHTSVDLLFLVLAFVSFYCICL